MSLLAAAIAGGSIGARHALETDHLAAVATLVNDDSPRSAFVGASWGVGHSLPVAAIGFAFLLLGVRIPPAVTALFEVLVGVLLVALGVRLLAGFRHEHAHGVGSLHGHVRIERLSIGSDHAHLDGDSLAVGALHGVAGSGALVIVLVAAAPDVPTAASFLTAFAVCSTLTMATVAALWGRTLAAAGASRLRKLAGAAGVGAGLILVVEAVGVAL